MDKKKILVVDDDPIILELVQSKLQENDYEISTASDGDEGLRKAREGSPDLIILDIILPKVDGYSIFKELRSGQKTKEIPVIILTAKGELKDLFAIEGVKDYIVKPFRCEELLDMVNKYLKPASSC